ncbi:MAG: methylated-DNA--[protein]-cysteine S-methyltransferase [Brevinema sp.]
MNYIHHFSSPVGILRLLGNQDCLLNIDFVSSIQETSQHSILLQAELQLNEYFLHQRTIFTIPFEIIGTSFQVKVWEVLQTIPYGTTCSYQSIAQAIDHPKAYRAVGNANNKNPLSIIIPCHRVIGADKSLTGYGGGLEYKKWLLNHEKQYLHK